MEKITIYGLPIAPLSALEQLKGCSFCVSYGTRKKTGRGQIEAAIRLVGEDGILLVDNGAFTHWRKGGAMTDEYVAGFAAWANDITERCPQAIVVLPDVIGGTADENWRLACKSMGLLDAAERAMPIWHMHEPIDYLLTLCGRFLYVGFGSSGEFAKVGTKRWHARVDEALAAIDAWQAETGAVRPRVHMMRAQSMHHMYRFDSSDSTNVAINHGRERRLGNTVRQFADRVDAKIQASAGPAAPHQEAAPLESLQAITEDFAESFLTGLGFQVSRADDGEDEDLRRAA